MTPNPHVLAVDLGLRTGVVGLSADGALVSANIVEAGPAGEGWKDISPERVERWEFEMMDLLQERPPLFVAYEQIQHMKGRGAVWIYGATALLHSMCIQLDIPCFGLNVMQVKKYATGRGNAQKPDMLAALAQVPGRTRELLWEATEAPTTPGRVLAYTERMREERMEDLVDAYWVGRFALDTTTISD